ncbi:hypothetical protein, partial [Craterilacuibacter sp.]|uniref:hypothetical protein n=1 Tax=Craterilacuibacter sp. TaxID=2870909 RepID=UPI003F2EDB71
TFPIFLQCECLASPSTHTYRLFVLLKSSAYPLVSFAASAEEAKYTQLANDGQHLKPAISSTNAQVFDFK